MYSLTWSVKYDELKPSRIECAEVYRNDEQKAASFTLFYLGTWRL